MARTAKYHEKLNGYGWPLFTSTQTDNRFSLCRKALCPTRKLTIKIKDCYSSDPQIQGLCKLKFLSEDYFDINLAKVEQLAWGGKFTTHKYALEGAFYPFVRCIERHRPIDTGCIWIGTRHEYPRIYVDNLVANWLCPYSKMGYVLTEPFEPLHRVIENWGKLANRTLYPFLNLPPVPPL